MTAGSMGSLTATKSRPELVTFDCYGTLVDWNAGILAAFHGEAERQQRETRDTEILAAYHEAEPRLQAGPYRTYRQVLALLETSIAEELGWQPPATPGYLAASLPSWPPFADTNPALERLSRAGYRLGILSNIDDDLLAATRTNLSVEFALLVTAEQLSSYKPQPAHFECVLAAVGGARRRLIHVAQSYFHDIQPAAALGIRTVWVNRLAEPRPPDGPGPVAEVPDLTAAADWLAATFS